MKKQACRDCKALTTESQCPVCKKESLTPTWQGKIFFVNSEKSFIAKQVGATQNREYAIKVR